MPARTRRAAPVTEASSKGSANDILSTTTGSVHQSSPIFPASSPRMPALGLKFSETLSWRAGRPIAVSELLRRLQALGTELQSMDQEERDPSFKDSFMKVAAELADSQLLAHKDRGVRAWAARCIVDLLRLCAPNAPFTEKQLKAIFEMIIKSILPALGDPSNAYNLQHMYVLESLATVKSILLVTDQSGSDALIKAIFGTFFDVLSNVSRATTGEQIAKAVDNNMTLILATLVDESGPLPQEVVDMIVAQFLRADPRVGGPADARSRKDAPADVTQSTLTMKEFPPAYNAAKTICNECPERMAREVSKYFSDVIVDVSGSNTERRRDSADADGLESSIAGLTEQDLAELDKAHRLLRELWRACPLVLQNVVPQLEQELSAESVELRVLATEALGDMASGIGAAGPPPAPPMDPAAYPPMDLSKHLELSVTFNPMTTPSSPQSFLRTHPHAYASFLGRRQDKSASVRAAWTIRVGRILTTSAGSMGLSAEEETRLVSDMARMLNDSDEKVRLAAVKTIGTFGLEAADKLGVSGGVDSVGSVLGNLGERIKDRKHTVRAEAMTVFARFWGVAAGEIAGGNDHLAGLVGGIPTKILNVYWTNEPEILLQMDRAVFENLLPLAYPPLKSKNRKAQASGSQRSADSQTRPDSVADELNDPARIRVERMLVLVKSLDIRARKIFFALSARQVSYSRFMAAYLQGCEDYNVSGPVESELWGTDKEQGGVMEKNETNIRERLAKVINQMAKILPDAAKAATDLWKFANLHDRRSYQLIRFCMAPESDYRTMFNAMKELKKRVEMGTAPAPLETLMPLLYRVAMILYNKSHVPPILDFARTDEKSLASVAHDVLTDVSLQLPEALKAHVQEICRHLKDNAPSATQNNPPGAVESLKACAAFARKMPAEIPSDRMFLQAMTRYALYGSPPEAAKHAVSVILASTNKKEAIAKDLMERCVKGFEFGRPGFLARLATMSRLVLLSPVETDREAKAVTEVAVMQTLQANQTRGKTPADQYSWASDPDDEVTAKCWAVKIIVNRIRSHESPDRLVRTFDSELSILNQLVAAKGEISDTMETPSAHKSRLRLEAALALLKLCLKKSHDHLLDPYHFVELARVAQDPLKEVRTRFLTRLKKYLARNSLPARFYTIPFLLASEPAPDVKADMARWIRSRAAFFAAQRASKPADETADSIKAMASNVPTALENVFARLLSLLAHHPDYDDSHHSLLSLTNYIVFYLSTSASASNVSLIYHIAERVKASRDAMSAPVTPNDEEVTDFTQRLHTLSDLATHAIRALIDVHGWTLTSLPARAVLSRSLFTEIKDHSKALAVAETNYLDDADLEQEIHALVRRSLRKGADKLPLLKKRQSEVHADEAMVVVKRPRTTDLSMREKRGVNSEQGKARKEPRKARRGRDEHSDIEESNDGCRRLQGDQSAAIARRRSGRLGSTSKHSYREQDDSEDDAELEYANGEGGPATQNQTVEESDTDMTEVSGRGEVKTDRPTSSAPPAASDTMGTDDFSLPSSSRESKAVKSSSKPRANKTEKTRHSRLGQKQPASITDSDTSESKGPKSVGGRGRALRLRT